jgi:hypothetical protein
MIKYALQCEFDHGFEAWFASSDAYDQQVVAGQLACPHCGSLQVTKAIMAPNVVTSRGKSSESEQVKAQRVMAEMAHSLRSHVEANFDYVGGHFASEARDMHEGLSPQRPIYGEATGDEVKSLIEDGIPVAPIPKPLPVVSHPANPAIAAPVSSPRIGQNVAKSRLN